MQTDTRCKELFTSEPIIAYSKEKSIGEIFLDHIYLKITLLRWTPEEADLRASTRTKTAETLFTIFQYTFMNAYISKGKRMSQSLV